MSDRDQTWKSSLPFPRRWIAYIVLKFVVLAIVTLVALRLQGLI